MGAQGTSAHFSWHYLFIGYLWQVSNGPVCFRSCLFLAVWVSTAFGDLINGLGGGGGGRERMPEARRAVVCRPCCVEMCGIASVVLLVFVLYKYSHSSAW